MRRVVVTGVGVITALGTGADVTWTALLEGRSAIGPIRNFDASSLRTRIAAEIPDFDPTDYVDRRTGRKMTRSEQLSVGGATLAVRDAGLDGKLNGERTALFTGSSKEVSDLTKLVDAIVGSTGEDGRGLPGLLHEEVDDLGLALEGGLEVMVAAHELVDEVRHVVADR